MAWARLPSHLKPVSVSSKYTPWACAMRASTAPIRAVSGRFQVTNQEWNGRKLGTISKQTSDDIFGFWKEGIDSLQTSESQQINATASTIGVEMSECNTIPNVRIRR